MCYVCNFRLLNNISNRPSVRRLLGLPDSLQQRPFPSPRALLTFDVNRHPTTAESAETGWVFKGSSLEDRIVPCGTPYFQPALYTGSASAPQTGAYLIGHQGPRRLIHRYPPIYAFCIRRLCLCTRSTSFPALAAAVICSTHLSLRYSHPPHNRHNNFPFRKSKADTRGNKGI